MTATTVRIIPQQMIHLLHERHGFSDDSSHMLARNIRIEDPVDQLFNSAKKRLARALPLPLARYGSRNGTPRAAADLSGDAGGNDRHALARELLHEQIQEAGVHRVTASRHHSLLTVVVHD
jgi:hypothetical protein